MNVCSNSNPFGMVLGLKIISQKNASFFLLLLGFRLTSLCFKFSPFDDF